MPISKGCLGSIRRGARSDPQIDLSDVFFTGKFLRASFTNRAAMLQDVDAIGNPQRRGRVLLDEQNGRAVARDR